MSFHGRTAACKPYITKHNARRQVEWSKAHQHWTSSGNVSGSLMKKSGSSEYQEDPFPYTGLEPRLLGACRGVTSHLLVLHKNLQPSAFAFIRSPKSSSMDPSSLCQHPQSLWSSDSEFYSISSPETISPAPSMDFSSSPSHQSKQGRSNKPGRPKLAKKPGSTRSRLKNPSEQRQNASEKEKLRMRDLTKALHHLRTYLPPSVAPAGQTLTKIETLRLTIRYISHLSAQLGLTEEYLAQKKQTDSSSG
ncbi:mesoderm posterior ba, partial [Pygocentrus nattereri]|uniref:mesoderm posterior ba n=1 Tax=Pygocentrus nattereri TaxID=42514 RepID=UPI001890FCB0